MNSPLNSCVALLHRFDEAYYFLPEFSPGESSVSRNYRFLLAFFWFSVQLPRFLFAFEPIPVWCPAFVSFQIVAWDASDSKSETVFEFSHSIPIFTWYHSETLVALLTSSFRFLLNCPIWSGFFSLFWSSKLFQRPYSLLPFFSCVFSLSLWNEMEILWNFSLPI